jgi:hypothetical protein
LTIGAVKNLLSGVTTVAHHDRRHSDLTDPSYPIRVVAKYVCAFRKGHIAACAGTQVVTVKASFAPSRSPADIRQRSAYDTT